MGNTKGNTTNVQKKGKGPCALGQRARPGVGAAAWAGFLLKKGRETSIRGEISRQPLFQNQSLGSMGPGKAKLKVG
jgi:hypothetical protein